jgi:flagellar basal body-associated protein FliL
MRGKKILVIIIAMALLLAAASTLSFDGFHSSKENKAIESRKSRSARVCRKLRD